MRLNRLFVASWLIALIVSATTLMWSCSHRVHDIDTLTVSLPPQKLLLDAIVGDKMKVNCLPGNGAAPKTYDPSTSPLINPARSRIYSRV